MAALLGDAGGGDGGGASVVLGRHGGGGTAMMGVCASGASAALVTVQGDGVIVYDCEAQVRATLCELKHGDMIDTATAPPRTR
jgi:hypothetical protein